MHKVLCQQYLTIFNYYNEIYFEKISKKEIKKWMVGGSLENNFIFFHLCLHHSPEQCHPTSHFSQGTIHILPKHIFRLLGQRPPNVSIFSVLKVSGNYHILHTGSNFILIVVARAIPNSSKNHTFLVCRI